MPKGTGDREANVPVEFSTDTTHLGEGDREALRYLTQAVGLMGPIFFEQLGQEPYHDDALFDPSRPTRFYPEDLTRTEFKVYLEQYPNEAEALRSHFTVVRRDGHKLLAIPYAEAYREQLERAALLLEEAALLSSHDDFTRFLRARAGSFRTNDFSATDRQWVETSGMPIELILGPFEEYNDKFMGLKRDFQGMLGVVNVEEQKKVQRYQGFVHGYDAYLAARLGYTPKTSISPMTVVDQIAGSGGMVYGIVPMASNLPNDQDIQRDVGSKKTFFRKSMEAKFNLITMPIAERVLSAQDFAVMDPKRQLEFIVGHELSHGLGFHFEGEYFGPIGSSFEEPKADTFGELFLFYLAEEGEIPQHVPHDVFVMHIADSVRRFRSEPDGAHAFGETMQLNWHIASGAVLIRDGQFVFDRTKFEESLRTLGKEFYEIAATRDPAVAKAFAADWGTPPPAVVEMAAAMEGIPKDIDPIFVS